MIVRIRQCCCALPTLVRLVAIFFLVFHLLLALSAAIWYTLFSSTRSAVAARDKIRVLPSGDEVDDRTFDTFLIENPEILRDESKKTDDEDKESSLDRLIVVILGIFAAIGILVNLLLMLAIKVDKRTLFLPWLVYHLLTVMGKWWKVKCYGKIIFSRLNTLCTLVWKQVS